MSGLPVMTEVDLARVWSDPGHWTVGVLYRAPSDPRLLVPMRFTNAAWTPNLAHPTASLLAIGLLALSLAPAAVAAGLGVLGHPLVAIGTILWFVGVVLPVGVHVRRGLD